MDFIEIKITNKNSNQTIKEFLKSNNIGRGKIEQIRVNKSSFINNIYKDLETVLKENDILKIGFIEEINYKCLARIIDIVYEDDYILVVNKPSGVIIHPDNVDTNDTLVNIVANYYKEKNIRRCIRYIHRIDKETTGLVIFAKDFFSEAILLKQIENHEIKKEYLALVDGVVKEHQGTINKNIGKDRHQNNKMCLSSTGKNAITKFEVIQTFKDYSLLKIMILTGRTHQIRVHLSSINHPLLGDVMYGGNMQYISRVALHSYCLSFMHPITKEKMILKCDLPIDMQNIILN